MLAALKAGATPLRMTRQSGSLAAAEIMLGCGGSLVPCTHAPETSSKQDAGVPQMLSPLYSAGWQLTCETLKRCRQARAKQPWTASRHTLAASGQRLCT